jgi:peptide/nickel transport system permease protein
VTTRRRVRIALIVLMVLHMAVFLAEVLAPYDPLAQHRDFPFAPPTRLHLVDASGRLHFWPFVYAQVEEPAMSGQYRDDTSRGYPLQLLVPAAPYRVAGLVTTRHRLFGVEEPARVFLLGTDGFGRDQLSRLLAGGRLSLTAGLLAAGVSLSLGLLIGLVAGFYGGRIDSLLMRFAELFLALPWLYLLFALRAFLPLDVPPARAFLMVVLVIGLVDWARPARLVRGVALSAREREYVLAARGFGASNAYLIRVHILPQAAGVALTQAAVLIPQYVLAEVALSFLGLGVGEPTPSWGNMLGVLQQYHVLASYWWLWAPALALVVVFLAYYALADALHAGEAGGV